MPGSEARGEGVAGKVGPGSESLQGVSRALRVLLLFQHERTLGVRDVGRRMGLNSAATHRIMNTLTEFGFLRRSDMGYELGPAVAMLNYEYRDRTDWSSLVQAELEKLHMATKETVGLHVLKDGLRTCVSQIESRHNLRMVVPLGLPLPVTDGAADKVFRAMGTDSELEKIESQVEAWKRRHPELDSVRAYEPMTESELEQVRAQGWASSRGARTPGSVAIAVPLATPQALYALTIFGPEERISVTQEKMWATELCDVAERLASIAQALDRHD